MLYRLHGLLLFRLQELQIRPSPSSSAIFWVRTFRASADAFMWRLTLMLSVATSKSSLRRISQTLPSLYSNHGYLLWGTPWSRLGNA